MTAVAPSGSCASAGRYMCVAQFDSSVLERTLRVVDAKRYVLT